MGQTNVGFVSFLTWYKFSSFVNKIFTPKKLCSKIILGTKKCGYKKCGYKTILGWKESELENEKYIGWKVA